jgi:hypothetical protein
MYFRSSKLLFAGEKFPVGLFYRASKASIASTAISSLLQIHNMHRWDSETTGLILCIKFQSWFTISVRGPQQATSNPISLIVKVKTLST